MDLATFGNIPRPFPLGGRDYPVSALTQYEWAVFQAWVKDYVPPILPPEASDPDPMLVRSARRNWPPEIASRRWFEALDHPGCFPALVRIAVGKHAGPAGLPDVEALALAVIAVQEGVVVDLIRRCLDLPAPDPDAPPPEEPPPVDEYEGDNPGPVNYNLARAMRWTHDEVMRLTFAQRRYYLSAGEPPEPGIKRFTSAAELMAHRAERAATKARRESERNGDGNGRAGG